MNERMKTYCACVAVGIGFQAVLFSGAWAYDAIEVKDGGSISGEIKFSGTPPTPEKIAATKDQEVCGKTEKVNESLLVGANKGIQNVVVAITNI